MKLQDFLLKLATDPDMLAKFRVEPNTIMIDEACRNLSVKPSWRVMCRSCGGTFLEIPFSGGFY